jgi:ABC-type nickel/cobalt efflux system permease component RcnA
MSAEVYALCGTAVFLGWFHTSVGPDHYLPFIVMSKARKWSMIRTTWITFLCGVGHVGSSVVLGLIGVALGIAADTVLLNKIKLIEEHRGSLAAWLLIIFGGGYCLWGLWRAVRNRPHTHVHAHDHDEAHSHEHTHSDGHSHTHVAEARPGLTPWILFTVFVFGPCEPLIPVVMAPAAQRNYAAVALVSMAFSAATIATMLVIVLAGASGLKLLPMGKLERYSHALAGLAICLSGLAIQILGL